MAKLHVIKKLRNERDILEVNDAELASASGTDKCVKLTGNQEISGNKRFKNKVTFSNDLSLSPSKVITFEGTTISMFASELLKLHQSVALTNTPILNEDTNRVEIEFSVSNDSNHFLYILTGENFFGITPISQTGEARGCMSMPVGQSGGSMLARYSLTKSASGYKFVFDSDYSTAIANNGHTFGTWSLLRLG